MRRSTDSITPSQEQVEVPIRAFLEFLRRTKAPLRILQQFIPKIVLEKKKLRKIIDITKDLTFGGYNPLHCIATEANFAPFMGTLKKCKDALKSWLEQTSEDEGMAPLHVMCLSQNAAMLEFFLKLKDKEINRCLITSGMQNTSKHQNAFLAFGESLLTKQDNALQFLDLLITLYGGENTVSEFLRESKDSDGKKFQYFVQKSENRALLERIQQLLD
jgi:hypothetical protein